MDLNKFKNKLIVFEGSDLTGKTTIAKKLVEVLNKENIPTIYSFQPGDPNYGIHANIIRSFCVDKRWDIHDLTNFFFFFTDKTEQASKIIKPALESGKTVVTDRWWYSTYAYQFKGKDIENKYNLNEEAFIHLNKMSVLFLEPDFVFYFKNKLDFNREVDKNDRFENEGNKFYEKVNKAYEYLSKKYNFIEIDKNNNINDTINYIVSFSR